MSTDPLIDLLTADLKPVRRRTTRRDVVIVLVLCALQLGLLLFRGDMRPDMHHAMAMPSFWWKTASLVVLATLAGATALLSLNPTRSPRPGLRVIGYVVLGALAIGWLIDAIQAGTGALLQRLDPVHGLECAEAIVKLSLPGVIALGLLVRSGAPVDPRGTAWAVGVAAASWGALAFVLSCPFDDPLYVAVWYLAACGTVALISRLILPLLTRW